MDRKWSWGALPLLLVVGLSGCNQYSDPVVRQVQAEGTDVQVAPEANLGSEGADKIREKEAKRQAEADRKAGRR